MRHSTKWVPWLGLIPLLAWALWSNFSGLANVTAHFCIALLACLSVTLLLGQGGLLSFGQAVYFGVGAYAAVLIKPWLDLDGALLAVWIMALPLVGGAVAVALAAVVGPWILRYGGIAFAMMTLAIGELVAIGVQSIPSVLGGEAGLAFDRSAQVPLLGWDLGKEHAVVVVMACYAVAGFFLTRRWISSPLGLAWRASRDNPERIESLGYALQALRMRLLLASSFLCGIAGALFSLYFEHVTTEVFGGQRSSQILLFALLGGLWSPWGAVVSSMFLVVTNTWLIQITPAWMLYVGLLFIVAVVHVPHYIVGLNPSDAKVRRCVCWLTDIKRITALTLSGMGCVALVEFGYRWHDVSAHGSLFQIVGVVVDIKTPMPWALAASAMTMGLYWWHRITLSDHA